MRASPCVRSKISPSFCSENRKRKSASSSSRNRRRGQNWSPWARAAVADSGTEEGGGAMVRDAVRPLGSSVRVSALYFKTFCTVVSGMISDNVTPSWARAGEESTSFLETCCTVWANREVDATWSTRFHSCARRPLMPSAVVQKMSARSRRTFRLSTRRVRPPVPGRTASSGTSGKDTEEEPSSTNTTSSQASANS